MDIHFGRQFSEHRCAAPRRDSLYGHFDYWSAARPQKATLSSVGDEQGETVVAHHPALPYLRNSEKGKVVTAAEAVRLIRDSDTVATGGFVGIGFAEEIALALEELYLSTEIEPLHGTGKPRNLTLIYAAGQGDGKEKGLNHFGHEGMLK